MKINLKKLAFGMDNKVMRIEASKVPEEKALRDDVYNVNVYFEGKPYILFKNLVLEKGSYTHGTPQSLEHLVYDILYEMDEFYSRMLEFGIPEDSIFVDIPTEYSSCFMAPTPNQDEIVSDPEVVKAKKSVKLEVPRRNEATYHDVLDKKSHDAWIEREAKALEEKDGK